MSARIQVDLGALSHPGKVRPNNEDHFLVARGERAFETLLTNLPPGEVPQRCGETVYGMLVADGMGGAAAGEVASRMAITTMVELVLRTPDWIMRLDEYYARLRLERMEQRFQKVAEALTAQARQDPNLAGMGTTMTVAASLGAELIVGHVGDSRAYLFHQGRLLRLTHDQTLAQALADAGVISPDEAATHFFRHMLTSVIGTHGREVKVQLNQLRLTDDDQLLLCTDGLTAEVSDQAIVEVLRRDDPVARACETLVGLSLARGGRDNVTVVLARYHIPG
jgi:protein phosphatase